MGNNITAYQQGIMQQAHGVILTIIWAGFADILLIIIKFYKHWQYYLLFHSLFGIFNIMSAIIIILTVIFDSSYLFNYAGFQGMTTTAQAHFLMGMIFLFCTVGIQILGLIVKMNIEDTKATPQQINNKKRIHKYFGYFFFLLSKVEIILGWYVYYQQWNPVSTFFCVYFGSLVFFVYYFFYRNYKNQSQILYINLQAKAIQSDVKNQSILEMLANGLSKKKIIEQFPDLKYVIYKNKVYDITTFNHPGGNFITKKIIGQQISRYIIGAYGLEILESSEAYTHSFYAQKLLQQYSIGQINYSKIDLLVPKIGQKINIPAVWTLGKAIQLGKSLKIFYFQSVRYKINPFPRSTLYLGRHFLLQSIEKKSQIPTRIYTLTLSMSPVHRQYIARIVDYLNHPESRQIPNEDFPDEIDQLPFVIKQYKVGGFSQYIHHIHDGTQIKIEGPFGRGLQLQQGNYYGFCGGTGVLPLLDLVYEILLQIYGIVSNKKYNRLPRNFKFILYLSINAVQDLKGLQLIPNTYLLGKKYKLDIFQLYIRVSKGSKIQNIPNYEQRLNHFMLKGIFEQQKRLKIAFVCGSPAMNYEVSKNLYELLSEDQVHIL